MSRRSEILTAVCTISCAIGIGYVMQSGEVAKLRYGTAASSSANAPSVVGEVPMPAEEQDMSFLKDDTELNVERIVLTSAKVDVANIIGSGFEQIIRASASGEIIDDVFLDTLALTPKCALTARATPQDAGMISLSLDAPCYGNERVSLHHESLVFSEKLSSDGTLDVMVPALAEDVAIKVSFGNGERITAYATVDDISLYDRVLLQWHGESGLQIHAREFGAEYGSSGHVWAGAMRDLSAAVDGQGGFLTRLGRADVALPMQAEVYSFPNHLTGSDGPVSLTVETLVTEENCGSEAHARVFQFTGGEQVYSQHLSMAIPNCDAVGNFLVLNNLLQDLTVASK